MLNAVSQQKITFKSEDDLLITADLYYSQKDLPYLILFHQAGYSRGEYKETAEKFAKLGYNCLAVDLRSGKEVNFVLNETAQRAADKNLKTDYLSALPDIQAAITYAFNKSKQRVVILGSSYSASLCLVQATNDHRVKAVIAYSPGEYFGSNYIISQQIKSLRKPTYITTSKREEKYAREIAQSIPGEYLSFFIPYKGNGIHGSRALWKESDSFDEYWTSLTMFFIKIKNIK